MQFRKQGKRIQLLTNRQVPINPRDPVAGTRNETRMLGSIPAHCPGYDLPDSVRSRLTEDEQREVEQHMADTMHREHADRSASITYHLPLALISTAQAIDHGMFVPTSAWSASIVAGIEALMMAIRARAMETLPAPVDEVDA